MEGNLVRLQSSKKTAEMSIWQSRMNLLEGAFVKRYSCSMSKAEFFQQLAAFTPEELQEVAIRVAELQETDGPSEAEKLFFDERIAAHRANPSAAEDWETVRDEILAGLKK